MIMQKWSSIIENIRSDVTLHNEFLETRLESEKKARQLIYEKVGKFNEKDITCFLNLCNTEIVPLPNSNMLRNKITRTRFQQSFIGQNRCLIMETLFAFNYWLERMWNIENDPIIELDSFWNASKDMKVKGAGFGLPTMVLYLREPEKYNVWLPFLNKAIGKITTTEFLTNKSRQNYEAYNNAVNNYLRLKHNLKPQEIDYILYRISKIQP